MKRIFIKFNYHMLHNNGELLLKVVLFSLKYDPRF